MERRRLAHQRADEIRTRAVAASQRAEAVEARALAAAQRADDATARARRQLVGLDEYLDKLSGLPKRPPD